MFNKFIRICKFTQCELKEYLAGELLERGYYPVIGDGYIYAKGEIPVLVTAHMDTVHKQPVKNVVIDRDEKGRYRVSSPQGIGGDDRCGIFMILRIIRKTKLRPHILFCEDEEIGGVGSSKFVTTRVFDQLIDLKYLIELDRANANDIVFYDCDNPKWTKFVEETTGYEKAWGSFSDISLLSPACGVASVNISCGYYNPHRTSEYVIYDEMMASVEVTKKLIIAAEKEETPQYEYIESKFSYKYWDKSYNRYWDYKDNYGYSYGGYYDNDYYNDWDNPYAYESKTNTYGELYVLYKINGELYETSVWGENKTWAFGQFFLENPNVCWNDIEKYSFS